MAVLRVKKGAFVVKRTKLKKADLAATGAREDPKLSASNERTMYKCVTVAVIGVAALLVVLILLGMQVTTNGHVRVRRIQLETHRLDVAQAEKAADQRTKECDEFTDHAERLLCLTVTANQGP